MLAINKKKTGAILLGLAVSLTGTVLAAPGNTAGNTDSRIAALEQQQQALAKELKALKSQNTKLKVQTNSQKNQLQGLSSSVKDELARVQISGFGRVAWDNDNIKGYIDQNDNRRTYLDLKGKFRVNDKWNFNFESETNQRYANSVMADGTIKSHWGHDDEDGVIQRVWAEGTLGKNISVDIGRRWRGLGFQNILFGNESDGLVIGVPVPQTKLKASTFYLTPTDKGYDFSIYGAGVQGEVGHGLQISAAFAKLTVGKNDPLGQNIYDSTTTYTTTDSKVTVKDVSGSLSTGGNLTWYGNPAAGTTTGYGEFQGASIYYTDAKGTATSTGTVALNKTYNPYLNTAGSHGLVLSAMWNPLKNIFFIGDYVRTNAQGHTVGEWGAAGYQETHFNDNASKALRLNYRWSNINDPGSFQLYARWYDYARSINGLVGIFGDKEWGALQPGSHGCILGFKYVPMKNIEWETMYEFSTAYNTLYGHKNETYHRNFLRTQVDFHF